MAQARAAQTRERHVSDFRPPPARHWRSYGADPLPTAAEALQHGSEAPNPSRFCAIAAADGRIGAGQSWRLTLRQRRRY